MKKNNFENKNSGIKILGIDPGTATTGWAIMEVDDKKLRCLGYGFISTEKNKPEEERLWEISSDLNSIIEKYKPTEAAVEKIFFFKNQKTVIPVAQARGAVLLTLRQKKVRISSYTPLQVKQALTGYGRAEKKQIQLMTKNILRLESIPKPDDAADAIAIAICHANSRILNNLKNKR